jgi:hypothetical protein
MKKLAILAALGIMAVSASCWAAAQATVSANNFDADKAIFLLTSGTPAGITDGVMVQIMAGPVGGAQALATAAGGTDTAFPINQVPGYFDGGTVTIPGVTAGSPADVTLRAFKGTSWDSATVRGSVSWSGQATGSWDPAAVPPAAPTGPVLAIPSSITMTTVSVPEPTTIALGLLGAAALLIRRRK